MHLPERDVSGTSTPVVKCAAMTHRRSTTHSRLLRIEDASTLREAARAASLAVERGFDGVEWLLPSPSVESARILAPGGPMTGSVSEGGRVQALAARCETVDLAVATHQLTSLLAGAAAVGALCLNITLPPVRADDEERGFARYQDALNFASALLAGLRWPAESNGVPVALEAVVGGGLWSPSELREIIDAGSSWALGACVDVPCVSTVAAVADWLLTLKRRVHCVRAGEATGSLDVQTLTHLLEEIRFTGPVVFRGCAAIAVDRSHP